MLLLIVVLLFSPLASSSPASSQGGHSEHLLDTNSHTLTHTHTDTNTETHKLEQRGEEDNLDFAKINFQPSTAYNYWPPRHRPFWRVVKHPHLIGKIVKIYFIPFQAGSNSPSRISVRLALETNQPSESCKYFPGTTAKGTRATSPYS